MPSGKIVITQQLFDKGQHLLRYLVYIDLNMVRTGVVSHLLEWPFGGYKEIQKPSGKYVLIAHQKLARLTGFEIYDAFRKIHMQLVTESLLNGNNSQQVDWSESIAVGRKTPISGLLTTNIQSVSVAHPNSPNSVQLTLRR